MKRESQQTMRHTQIERQIQHIEGIMQELSLSSSHPPAPSAFNSSAPFCYDTMTLLEWLQWVMFPRTRELLDKNLPLPTVCEIHPLAEEEFKQYTQNTDTLLSALLKLDNLFNIPH